MDIKPTPTTPAPAPVAPPVAPRTSGSHRSVDMRDAMAEMAERAQLISLEAGTKVAAAMKDVISAAAGIAGFAVESARDLVQYMVRRGQMTQDEADKLIREAEDAHRKRSPAERSRPTASKVAADRAAAAKAERAEAAARELAAARAEPPAPVRLSTPAKVSPPPKSSAAKRPSVASAAAKPAAKASTKKSAKGAAAEKKSASKKPAKKRR